MHTHIYTCTNIHNHTHVYAHTHTYTHICTHIYMHTQMHTHAHTSTYTHIHIHTQGCLYIRTSGGRGGMDFLNQVKRGVWAFLTNFIVLFFTLTNYINIKKTKELLKSIWIIVWWSLFDHFWVIYIQNFTLNTNFCQFSCLN